VLQLKNLFALALRELNAIAIQWSVWFGALPQRHVTVGRHTYGLRLGTIPFVSAKAPVDIGSFCSIAYGVRILSHADHPQNLPSLFPFRARVFGNPAGSGQAPAAELAVTKGPISIGHDVWIGINAVILSGVTVGAGAIIGAASVVTRDVPPYAVVAGNPARIIRFRFAPEIIERLLASRWWELSDAALKDLQADFYNPDIEAFLGAVHAKWRSLNLPRPAPMGEKQ